jgi:hypothetical protein
MKYLLSSAGIKNPSIHDALIDLLGKPIAESSALCIPTAIYPFPGGPSMAYRFINGSTSLRGWDWLTLRCFHTWITRITWKVPRPSWNE